MATVIDDSEVRLVRTCSRWKCLRGPLPAARTCSPRSRVRLRGSAHFGGETCARKDQRSKTDVTTNVVYKECSELLLLPLVLTEKWRSLIYPLWNSKLWISPWSSLWNSFTIPVYSRIFFIQLGTIFHTVWYVSSQTESTKGPMLNIAPFSDSQQLPLHYKT